MIIISMSYFAPVNPLIPTIEINENLNFQLLTIMIEDFNAHLPLFNNSLVCKQHCDTKGKTLAALAAKRNLTFLGPPFYTFVTK